MTTPPQPRALPSPHPTERPEWRGLHLLNEARAICFGDNVNGGAVKGERDRLNVAHCFNELQDLILGMARGKSA